METDFQPSFLPMINILPRKDLPSFMNALATFLAAKIGEYPRILADIADPSSLIYVHVKMVFETMISYPPGLNEDSIPYFFHEYVIQPALAFIGVGEKAMAMNLGAQIKRGQNSPINPPKPGPPFPPKIAEPVRQVVSPPRQPSASSRGGGVQAPTPVADSSENRLYMSRLEGVVGEGSEAVALGVDIMRDFFLIAKFPSELANARFSVRPLKREGYPPAIIVGPPDNPHWADQMMAAKVQSRIKFCDVHMSKARSKRVQSSPGRSKEVEDLTADLRRLSVRGASQAPMQGSPPARSSQSPMQQSPAVSRTPPDSPLSGSVSSVGGEKRKRGIGKEEGVTKLTYEESGGEAMQISSPPPVQKSKQANVGQTPALVREMKMQSGPGSGPPNQGRGNTLLEGDDDDEVGDAGASSVDKEDEEEEDPFALGDDAPSAPEEHKVREDEAKGDEDAMPN